MPPISAPGPSAPDPAVAPAACSPLSRRIATAARELFAERGYDQTTVDAIAERAGVGRRTVFRHFGSKDDAIFPDHRALERRALEVMRRHDDRPPVLAVCAGAEVVFACYVDDPAVSVERYRLSRTVPALRARETAVVAQYQRSFSRYLLSRRGGDDEPGAVRLWADVTASAVVAAHNQVLREWLAGGGAGDPLPALHRAFAWVVQVFERPDERDTPPGPDGAAARGGLLAVAGEH